MIRRKLAVLSIFMSCEILVYEAFGILCGMMCAVAMSFFLVLGLKRYSGKDIAIRSSGIGVVLLIIWFSFFHMFYIDSQYLQLPRMEGIVVEVEGVVSDIDVKRGQTEGSDKHMLTIKVDDPVNEKILIKTSNMPEGIAVGDRIRARGKIGLPSPRRNPNTFDYKNYLKTKGIYSAMSAKYIYSTAPPSKSIAARLYRLKSGYLDRVEKRMGEERAALTGAILFGDKGMLDEDVMETFRKNGTAHILAVSGLHIGMLYAFLLRLWNMLSGIVPGLFGRRGAGFFLFIGAILTGYVFLADFSPSVVRAVIMILLHIFATMTGRYYDLKSAAYGVAAGSMIYNPLVLFQSGFQMSFLAVLCMSVILPYMKRMVPSAIVASLTIQAGLTPYMIYQFNWFSPLAFLINIPVIFTAGVYLPMGVVGLTLHWTSSISGLHLISGLVDVFGRGAGFLGDILIRLNNACCIDGMTAVRVCSPSLGVIFAFYLFLFAFASEGGRLALKRMGRRYAVVAALAILIFSAWIGGQLSDDFGDADMVFVDVGQGDCMHIRVHEKSLNPIKKKTRNYLIDGGGSDSYPVGEKTLRSYLLKNKVRTIDGAFVSHLHTDHYKGICELARCGMIRRIYVYEANRLKLDQICEETGMKRENILFLCADEKIKLCKGRRSMDYLGDEDPSVEILWPERKMEEEYKDMLSNEEDENGSSLIMKVTVDGISMLATGDLGEEGERQIISRYGGDGRGSCGILKVGHHGSKYSTCQEFLDWVDPDLAVIQVGEHNTYGHPTPETLERIGERGIPILRNDMMGAIGLKIQNGRIISIKKMI